MTYLAKKWLTEPNPLKREDIEAKLRSGRHALNIQSWKNRRLDEAIAEIEKANKQI